MGTWIRTFLGYILLFSLLSCGGKNDDLQGDNEPLNVEQWLDPLFYNDVFESEISFPLWFNDSIIRVHRIEKITKRTFPLQPQDSVTMYYTKNAMPKEKIEYYFSEDGSVDRIAIYYYYDDREIARVGFNYTAKKDHFGFAPMEVTFAEDLTNGNQGDDFQTDKQFNRTDNFVIHRFIRNKKKYAKFQDLETGQNLFLLKNEKHWGTLSVDTILKPSNSDWIIWGTYKHPIKRYQVSKKVKVKNVHRYEYWKTGVLKQRIIENYPFERKRSYQYNSNNQWISYVDSSFSEDKFISASKNIFEFDKYQRPILINHTKVIKEDGPLGYLETFRYEAFKE
jgi:hypothetical protein